MQVSEAMTNDVKIASPNQSIRDAARLMAQIDAGVLPVGENDRLVGMITDRDITIRAVGADKGPRTPIREIMSKEVMYCFEDDDLDDIVQNMADVKLRRLPVLNREKRLVGILSLGDIALTEGAASAGRRSCSRLGGAGPAAAVVVEELALCTARAAAISPSGWNAFWLPTGARMIGVFQVMPNSSVDVSTLLTSTSRRGRI